ncbi:ATP-binding protein [Nocardia asteroides]|uniref:ATP-binding protein n=1 Tax=Nocardia asteroides TaxID=1824 RepID=UPI00343F5B73
MVARSTRSGDLPAASDDIVGREAELDRIVGMLMSRARLVTLIGPGGIGKTRLAAEAIRRIHKSNRIPVHWVRLAQLAKDSDAALVEAAICRTVVGADFSARADWEALVAELSGINASERSKRPILVMDNCEHLLAGAGQVLSELLDAVPGLTILATSRAAVGWVDEHVLVISPLSLPDAVALFRTRAELTGHPIVAHEDIVLTRRICRHLDHYPLYIRLAAARLMRQPLATIVRDLSGEISDERTRWPQWPRFGVESRHKGVHDAIAWSYDLCLDQERLLLDRMSVFATGYDGDVTQVGVEVPDIIAVCADDPVRAGRSHAGVGMPAADIPGVLERLVDQSLVSSQISPTAVRYCLLESVRVFAGQRLEERSTAESDEPSRLARRHLRHYRDVLVGAQRDPRHRAEHPMLDRLLAAWDNVARAIEMSLAVGEPRLGLEIATSLHLLPFVVGSPREVRSWTERTLRASRVPPTNLDDLQITAMALIGWSDLMAGKIADGERMFAECVGACTRDATVGDGWTQRPEIDAGLAAAPEFLWGVELLLVHRDPSAVAVLARARQKASSAGECGLEAICANMEVWAASFVGSADQALGMSLRYLEAATASDSEWAKGFASNARAIALAAHASPADALAVGRGALEYHLSTSDRWGQSWAVHIRLFALGRMLDEMLAAESADRAELAALATETAQLAGGAAGMRVWLGIDFAALRPLDENLEQTIDIAREILGRDGFSIAFRQGTLLQADVGEVQRLALGTLSTERLPIDHPARKAMPSRWGELTEAEKQVAHLAAAGWTNAAIAARRGSSAKTIDAQMVAILRKLVIASRVDIAALVPEDEAAIVRSEAAKRPHRAGGRRAASPSRDHRD